MPRDRHEKQNDLFLLAEDMLEWMLTEKGVVPSSRELAEALLAQHRHKVEEWLKESSMSILSRALATRLTDLRRHLHRSEQARRILDGRGDTTYDVARIWQKAIHVPSIGYKALGDLVASDHMAIANEHTKTAATHTKVAAMHEEIAATLGGRHTSEVFTPEEIINLWSEAYQSAPLMAV